MGGGSTLQFKALSGTNCPSCASSASCDRRREVLAPPLLLPPPSLPLRNVLLFRTTPRRGSWSQPARGRLERRNRKALQAVALTPPPAASCCVKASVRTLPKPWCSMHDARTAGPTASCKHTHTRMPDSEKRRTSRRWCFRHTNGRTNKPKKHKAAAMHVYSNGGAEGLGSEDAAPRHIVRSGRRAGVVAVQREHATTPPVLPSPSRSSRLYRGVATASPKTSSARRPTRDEDGHRKAQVRTPMATPSSAFSAYNPPPSHRHAHTHDFAEPEAPLPCGRSCGVHAVWPVRATCMALSSLCPLPPPPSLIHTARPSRPGLLSPPPPSPHSSARNRIRWSSSPSKPPRSHTHPTAASSRTKPPTPIRAFS